MSEMHENFPEHLNFSQRYGYEPLPRPMRLEEISEDLRREIGNRVRSLILNLSKSSVYGRTLNEKNRRYFERVLGKFTKSFESEIPTAYNEVSKALETIIKTGLFNKVLDLLEIMIDELSGGEILAADIKDLFIKHSAAYWLDTSKQPFRFVPCASKHQGEATRQAIEIIQNAGMDGAATHLRQAAEHINAKQFSDSIADSIHAVESVARMIDPGSKKTLGPALRSLEKAGVLKNRELKTALEKLYHYTNTEQGIRHALTDQTVADVGLTEAIFMFGACASFAAYLTSLHQQVKERDAGST